jgi:hypothetical protein
MPRFARLADYAALIRPTRANPSRQGVINLKNNDWNQWLKKTQN